MRMVFGFLAGLATALLAVGAAPAIDKAKLAAYIRYAEGFMADVHFVIDDPAPSSFPNFYRVNVHLSTDAGAKLDRVYYMTEDGKEIVNGTLWNLSKSPFAETLDHLPDNGYAFGPADAKVKLVIFSDFECPYCREFAKTVRENIPKKYPKDVRVVFEDFPLESIHPWARAAAEASHCVGSQSVDAFWAYHDWIFAHAADIKPETLRDKVLAWAKDQKLDTDKLAACMDSHVQAGAVEQAENAGKALQVVQTPTAFMNGRAIPGAMKWDGLESVIKLELAGQAGVKPADENQKRAQPVP
jgi:protein-disulfide isomerase